MNANDPNVALLALVAGRLGVALREQMVFVGGAIAGLLITDPAMPAIRPTDDVDLVCKATVLADYHRVERALRDRGFVQDMRPEAPICRWRIGPALVDVVPTRVAVVDGRETLLLECQACVPELRTYLGGRFHALLQKPSFREALAGHLPGDVVSQERLPSLQVKLAALARIASA